MQANLFKINKEYFSKENCSCLKGIFAVAVLWHHLYQHSGVLSDSPLGTVFQALGYLAVAEFFFLSGYGLMCSYLKKGSEYIEGFLKRRIAPFYAVIVISTLLYGALVLIAGQELPLYKTVLSFAFGDTIIVNGWYLQVQLLLYIMFLLAFSAFKSKSVQSKILALTVCVGLYIVIASLFLPVQWYEAVLAFVLGLLWSEYKEKADSFLTQNKRWYWCASLLFTAFVMLFVFRTLFAAYAIGTVLKTAVASVFVCLVAVLVMKIPVSCKLTRFLGTISMEIYISQGVFLTLFHSRIVYINSNALYIVLVIVCTLLSSVLLKKLFSKILK